MSMTTTGASALLPTNVSEAVTLAKMMADGDMLPKEFKGRPANVLMVIELAMRFGMSPFAMTQEVSVVQGKLMLSGKIAAAALHGSGVLSGRLSYEYAGTNGQRQVTVCGTLRGEDKQRCVVVRLADAKTANQMWTKQPDQQLAYHGARVWGRRHAPEVLLGVYSPEEFDGATQPAQDRPGMVIEGEAQPASKLEALERAINTFDREIPNLDTPAPAPAQLPQATEEEPHWLDTVPEPDAKPPQEVDRKSIQFRSALRNCATLDDLLAFTRKPEVIEYRTWLRENWPKLDAAVQADEARRFQALRPQEEPEAE